MRTFILTVSLVVMLSIPTTFANQDTGTPSLELDDTGTYHLEVIADNFNFTLIDLNKVDRLIQDGTSLEEARNQSMFFEEIDNLEYARNIIITAKSKNGTHGLFIDELDIDLVIEKPQPNEEFGTVQNITSVLPSVDSTLQAYCNVYCGEGHSEMTFTLIVGEGLVFNDQNRDILRDWRIWVLFAVFGLVILFVIAIALKQPGGKIQNE